jgi:hypothetical protein
MATGLVADPPHPNCPFRYDPFPEIGPCLGCGDKGECDELRKKRDLEGT